MIGPQRLPCEIPGPQAPRIPAPRIPEAPAAPARAAGTRWLLPATIVGSSLGFIDGSVVNVALPAMQHGLQAQLATIQWVVNGYMLTLAGLILLGGSAADRFGRRRVFLIGLAGFGIASAACGLAPSVAWLIAARLVQGAAAALLVPASLAIIGAAYSGPKRARAIGTWAGAAALTTALGPPLGGWLIDTLGWRAIFFVNPPIAICGWLMALRIVPDRGAAADQPLDWRGASLAFLALALISYGLIAIGQRGRAAGAVALAAAVPAVWWFIRTEARARAPMMPMRLFRSQQFSGANGLTVLLYAALSGALFLLPFVLINLRAYSAAAAGAALLPFPLLMGTLSRAAGGLVGRFGARPPLIVGPLTAACGYAWLGLSVHFQHYWSAFLPGLVLIGIGMTIAVAPLTATVFESTPTDQSGVASGINNAAARAGGLIAVAALGLAFGSFDTSSSATAPLGASAPPGTSALAASALLHAYRLVMLVAAALAALGAATAAATIGRKHTSGRKQ